MLSRFKPLTPFQWPPSATSAAILGSVSIATLLLGVWMFSRRRSKPKVEIEEDNNHREIPINPTSLRDFGFEFNEEGLLVDVREGTGYSFDSQAYYQMLGKQVAKYVEDMLENYGLQKLSLPHHAPQVQTHVYVSQGWEDCEKLLVLSHGPPLERFERPGVWDRKLIISDGLRVGSQLPYIEKARDEGYEVCILQPNLNYVMRGEEKVLIPGHERPELHFGAVWEEICRNSSCKKIYFVVHSFAGIHFYEFLKTYVEKDMKSLYRIAAIAFADSLHVHEKTEEGREKIDAILKKGRNWVKSREALGTIVRDKFSPYQGVMAVSSACDKHARVPSNIIDDVFSFFEEMR